MTRLVRLALLLVTASIWLGGIARAQAESTLWSVQGDLAATLGHSSSTSFGGELDRQFTDALDAFVEIGHMSDITTQPVQDRATLIASALGGTANPIVSALYYDLGVRYKVMPGSSWHPYITLGFGAARVDTSTAFTIAGGGVSAADLFNIYKVSLGLDLDGFVTKFLIMAGAGIQHPLGDRFFVDGSYRYGHISASGKISDDRAVSTQRVQAGFGIKF
jgi:opacity protein-like surface antigen